MIKELNIHVIHHISMQYISQVLVFLFQAYLHRAHKTTNDNFSVNLKRLKLHWFILEHFFNAVVKYKQHVDLPGVL